MEGTSRVSSPFGAEPVEEVPLIRAPLARVLTQIRFPRLSALSVNDDAANRIAIELAADFPIFNEGREQVVTITPEGVSQQPGAGRNWQLQDAEQEWQVTFAPDFVALHTSAYVDRHHFVERLNQVIKCFADVARPPRTDRIGMRYINRLEEQHLARLPELLRPEMLGGLAVPTVPQHVLVVHALNEALYNLPSTAPHYVDSLQARWGQIPAGATLDPTLPPVSTPSFLLDLDSFRMGHGEFTPSAISDCASELAERAYRFFRWTVTEQFLDEFGAEG